MARPTTPPPMIAWVKSAFRRTLEENCRRDNDLIVALRVRAGNMLHRQPTTRHPGTRQIQKVLSSTQTMYNSAGQYKM